MSYDKKRRAFRYYRQALGYLRRYCPAGAVLDVGGGVSLGCRYLENVPEYDRTSIELPGQGTARLPGVRVILSDFCTWKLDQQYDAVLCLQVLEHVADPTAFAQSVLDCAPVCIISVPYLWPAGSCQDHRHDEIGMAKLLKWAGREPTAWQVVKDDLARLVAVYNNSS